MKVQTKMIIPLKMYSTFIPRKRVLLNDKSEPKRYKALYFDIRIKDLEQYYSSKNPKGAYRKIKHFLIANRFSHEQFSGYHSLYKTTDLEIFELIGKMKKELPWLQLCVNHFEVTNIGANYNLIPLFVKNLGDSIEVE